jgi:RNA polymerase sigma factor (sigma-70 family)
VLSDFETWYREHWRPVCAAVSLAAGNTGLGEEAAAEAFARAMAQWSRVRKMESPTGWVYRVAINELRTGARRRRLEQRFLHRHQERHTPPPVEPDDALWRAVAALPPRTRTAVALRYIADLSEREVADAMGISRGTVAATLHAARARLAALLTPAEEA